MLGNQLLMSAVTGWVVAQFLKTLIDFALNKNLCPVPTPPQSAA